jgi:hypothetical protein
MVDTATRNRPAVVERPRPEPPERRGGPDRRRRPTTLRSALFHPQKRRRGGRRAGETEGIYTDQVRTSTVVLALFVLLASALDLALTLIQLARGAEEANWIMARALEGGVHTFAQAKMGLTVAGCLVLVAHERFRLGALGLRLTSAGYAALLSWHLALFLR